MKNNSACKVSTRSGSSESAGNPHGDKNSTAVLKRKLQKLKRSFKVLSSEKDAEVAALVSQKDFVWNQYNKMDNDYTSLLKTKRIEVEQANEAIQKLELNIRNLQSSVIEKSETIARLEAERARLESDLRRQTQEAEKSSHEVERLQLVVKRLQSSIKEKDVIIEELKNNLPNIEQNVPRSSNKKSRFFTEQDSQRKLKASVLTPGRRPRRNSRNGSENSEASSGKRQRCASQDSSVSHASSSTRVSLWINFHYHGLAIFFVILLLHNMCYESFSLVYIYFYGICHSSQIISFFSVSFDDFGTNITFV